MPKHRKCFRCHVVLDTVNLDKLKTKARRKEIVKAKPLGFLGGKVRTDPGQKRTVIVTEQISGPFRRIMLGASSSHQGIHREREPQPVNAHALGVLLLDLLQSPPDLRPIGNRTR